MSAHSVSERPTAQRTNSRSTRSPTRKRDIGAGEHPTPRALGEPRALRRWLSTHHSLKVLETELDDAIDRLLHQAESFETQLADFGLSRLGPPDAFQFFRQLVNYDPAVSSAVPPTTPETTWITSSPTRRSIATEII